MSKYNIQILVILGLATVVVILLFVLRKQKKKVGTANSKNFVSTSTLAASLRDEKLRSGIILNAIEDGVVLIDGQQTIQLFNPGAAKITGWKSEEAVGLDWASVLKFVDAKGQEVNEGQEPITRLFQEGKSIKDNTANLQTKSGKSLGVNLVVTPLLDQQQHVTGAVAIFRDVTLERQEEQQRAEFISTASHEMRTPVAAIEGYLALALNDKVSTVDARARDYLDKAHASTQHLGKLFQDLLTSAKAEDGRLTNHPAVLEVGDWLEQIVSDLKFTAEKKGLGMDFIVGNNTTIDASQPDNAITTGKVLKPLYYTHVDPDRMREVVTNLFDNAVKYTESGNVSVGLTGNDQVVQIYIRDTGPGIPAEDIKHLFQKFYRVDNSATRTIGGTGLGLFICRKIVELYGGRIWVESEVGKGSTFFINLPRMNTKQAEQMKTAEAGSTTLTPITSLTTS
ncbi:MAG TPA: PAS domain-containing sensor histidine kinase [Candidatus Saccharimonadales bacterium]|nr:PAS domain-containing sensor histidine kinase [Candidatus Saccharimonadales bacterium]